MFGSSILSTCEAYFGVSEGVGDFAVGQAGTLVEVDDRGLGVGAERALGGARGVAGLQPMAAA
jgi:hypothetical protein